MRRFNPTGIVIKKSYIQKIEEQYNLCRANYNFALEVLSRLHSIEHIGLYFHNASSYNLSSFCLIQMVQTILCWWRSDGCCIILFCVFFSHVVLIQIRVFSAYRCISTMFFCHIHASFLFFFCLSRKAGRLRIFEYFLFTELIISTVAK